MDGTVPSSDTETDAQGEPSGKRRDSRHATYQTVRWDHKSGEDQGAAILDMGPGGVFLTPFGKVPSTLQGGDTVWLSLRLEGREEVLAATVRWRGFSKLHGTAGFGIEFDDRSREKAKDLCLQMTEKGLFFVPE